MPRKKVSVTKGLITPVPMCPSFVATLVYRDYVLAALGLRMHEIDLYTVPVSSLSSRVALILLRSPPSRRCSLSSHSFDVLGLLMCNTL